MLDSSRANSRDCVSALGHVLGLARSGAVDSVVVLWWPAGAQGSVADVRWLIAGRAAQWPNDAHAGAGRLMRALCERPASE